MARVALIAPPYVELYGKLQKAAGRYFPLGLAYIASYLRKYGGHEVAMYEPEAQGLSYEDIALLLKEDLPDVVGITSTTPNFPRAIKLAQICRQNSKARIVLGGVHPSALPEHIMRAHSELFDCVVIGEGEETMLEVVNNFASGKDAVGVKGCCYIRDGEPEIAGLRPFVEDLDSIPFPARDLIPQGLFMPNAHNARYKECFSILTSRGCPFNCSFCAARIVSGKKYRAHSPGYVLEEMKMLKRDYGARQLLITDDTFTLNRGRLQEICESMIRESLGLKWFCFSQVSAIDRETLKLMKRAGCYNIGFGVESSDPAVLRNMGKNISPDAALKAVRDARSLGIKTQAFYVFGTPGETISQMRDTIEFSKKVGATLAFFNMLVPYPGTKDFDYFFGDTPIEDIQWERFVAVGESCVLSREAGPSPEEIKKLIAKANIKYYMSPTRLMNLLYHIRTPYELLNYLRGGVGFARQIKQWLFSRNR